MHGLESAPHGEAFDTQVKTTFVIVQLNKLGTELKPPVTKANAGVPPTAAMYFFVEEGVNPLIATELKVIL
jgi:hypothetical protein